MEASPFLAGWRLCPRCGANLALEGRAASCPACGLRVHANPAPTASALLLDDEGRVLLARRGSEPGDGLWDLLGGFIEEGEEPVAALRREVAEETALEIEIEDFVGGFPDRYGDDGVYTVNFYWTARIAGGELELDEDELREVRWFSADDLPPAGEFAFRNTLEALASWREGVRSPGREK
jgi:ADP-ribose pyrophosphatase YjhB (NUDIX family)